MNRIPSAWFLSVLLSGGCALAAGPDTGARGIFRTEVPPQPFSLILGRPTGSNITFSILASAALEGYVEYARAGNMDSQRTKVLPFSGGEPRELILDTLAPDTSYRYAFWYRTGKAGAFRHTAERTFHTWRPPGSTFTFTVTADSHLDENTDTGIYAQTLRSAGADHPDFHIDLGNTFMTDKRGNRPEDALPQYLAQRYYFGELCGAVPLFLVLGNHDGESGPSREAATRMRTAYYPNPLPDSFYTGSPAGNYYAWEWGDALFVVLDPYRYARPTRGGTEPWNMTLGKTQYDWLARTLRSSKARHKFVFIHQLTGGLDRAGRGGAEAVPYYEWGGHERSGENTFGAHRPGWDKPIHDLLVETGVQAVFHGHDHFFAKQVMDGVVYQLVPQPGHRAGGRQNDAADYGYESGILRTGPGYLRVVVGEEEVVIAGLSPEGATNVVYRIGSANRSGSAGAEIPVAQSP